MSADGLCKWQAEQPAVDKDGWFETGDVATIDKHGFMAVRLPAYLNPHLMLRQ